MNNKLKPALLGGLIVGVLSGICSIIPFLSLCCCIWSIGGGGLAAYLYIKSSPNPVAMGEGAMVGGMAGAVGAVIYLIINLPFAVLYGVAAMQEQLYRSGVSIPFSGVVLALLSGIIGAIILLGLATLGGVIGVAIFEKRKGGAAPPTPNGF